MCGRYSIVITEEQVRKQFSRQLKLPPGGLVKNYNVAPTQNGLVLTNQAPDQLAAFRWGLVPFWAKDLKIGARMINARREGIEEKPSFRKPIRERRCLVLADSFYEWQGRNGKKQPYRIKPTDGSLLIMAGIWEQWRPKDQPDAQAVFTYSIITGAPNQEMNSIHDRMPMLLINEELQNEWLAEKTPLPRILDLLKTPPNGTLEYYPVSPLVGNVRNKGEALHEEAEVNREDGLSLF